jgi:glucose/arabinose dehydrogenase
MNKTLVYKIFFAFLLSTSHLSYSADLPEGFVEQIITDELNEPTSIAFAPDGRIFISEKSGNIWVLENGELLPDPFYTFEVDVHGERGLGQIRLHPDFDQNGWLYAYYNVAGDNVIRLVRLTANGNRAVPGSEELILETDPTESTNHNGGTIRFSQDGKLFLATGDGVHGPNSQNMGHLLGKMLRMNDDGSVPDDNPFVGEVEGKYQLIYALGLRNPYTFDLDPETGIIYVNEVGEATYEEINRIEPGKNYGWPIIEGPHTTEDAPENYMEPIHYYGHDVGCAPVGGAFYSPETKVFPEKYHGMYLWSDFCTGTVSVMDPATDEIVDTFMTGGWTISNISVNDEGDLYYLSFNAGQLVRITYTGSGEPFIVSNPKDQYVVEGEDAQFDIRALGDAPLSYEWYKNETVIADANADSLIISNSMVSDSGATIYCKIENGEGVLYSDTVVLRVTSNQRPVPSIDFPTAGATYQAGDTLIFKGSANDPETGMLDPSSFEWNIEFRHDLHAHPGLIETGVDSSGLEIGVVGELDTNVWFRINFTVTDEAGLEQSTFLDVHPEYGNLTVQTNIDGLPLWIDGKEEETPHFIRNVVGVQRTFEAPKYNIVRDSLYEFIGWSNGEQDSLINVLVPAGEINSLTANYEFRSVYIDGLGTGLTGEYFNAEEITDTPDYSQIDASTNHNWGWGGAFNNANEPFAARWTGDILAPVTGEYKFHFEYNDGIRVYLSSELILDDWDAWPDGSSTVCVDLEAGERYPIQIDYIEHLWQAWMMWRWEHPYTYEADFVPTEFLYPENLVSGVVVEAEAGTFKAFPNPTTDILYVSCDENETNFSVKITDLAGVEMSDEVYKTSSCNISIDLADLPDNFYLLHIESDSKKSVIKFLKK